MSELMEVKELIERNNKLLESIIKSKDNDFFFTIEEAASFAKLSTQTIHKHKEKIAKNKLAQIDLSPQARKIDKLLTHAKLQES